MTRRDFLRCGALCLPAPAFLPRLVDGAQVQAMHRAVIARKNAVAPGGGTIITIDAVTGTAFTTNANNPVSSHTQGNLTNGYILVFIAGRDPSEGDIISNGVTYDGVNMDKLGALTMAGFHGIEVYGLELGSKTSGSYNASINDGSGDAEATVTGVVTLNNCHQTNLPTIATASGTSTAPTVNVSSTAGELVIGGVVVGSDTATVSALGADQSQVLALTRDASLFLGLALSSEEGAPTVTMSNTLSASVAWLQAAVALEPAP